MNCIRYKLGTPIASVVASQLVLIGLCGVAFAEHRAALLIANSAYPDAELSTPSRDAKAMAEALKQRGFRVRVAENQSGKDVKQLVTSFRRALPTNGTALIYFSGYALLGQRGDDRDNVLLPVDGNADSPYHVSREPFGVKQVLNELCEMRYKHAGGGSSANIIVVDGCYPHPAQSESDDAPRGLARLDAEQLPPGSMVAYAAPPGEVMQPPEEGVAPFTAKLVRLLDDRGRSLHEALQAAAGHIETNLSDTSFLEAPATRAIAPPSRLPVSGKVGDEWVNDIGMVFCWCPSGKFTMGSPVDDPRRYEDEGPVDVTISQGFWMGKFELTLHEYAVVSGRKPFRSSTKHKNAPVNALEPDKLRAEFLKPLNEAGHKSGALPQGWEYALPTEAQWEYAARAGTQTPWYFGADVNDLPRHGNFADRTLYDSPSGKYGYAHPNLDDGVQEMARVGRYLPNPWGLHDVYGNLWEWCDAKYAPQLSGKVDPTGDQNPKTREHIARGGCWLSPADYCRSAMRGRFEPGHKNVSHNIVGVRIVIRRRQ